MRKLRRYYKLLVALYAAIMFWGLVAPSPVHAIAIPTTPTTIGTVELYSGILEAGDLGVLLDFHIDYPIASLPTETVTQAFIVAFNDTDGTTHLKTVVPYALLNKGYYEGLAWIYFTKIEVTADSIDVADILNYRVEVYGNPALTWVPPAPVPTTSDTIDTWNTTGDIKVLLSLDILAYATSLESTWLLDLIKDTTVGKKLSLYGEEYFENVISGARLLAPNAFYKDTTGPIIEELDYTPEFGATITNGTGLCTGSPIQLISGVNTVPATGDGTFVLVLKKGTVGTAASIGGSGTVNSSPVTLVSGINTITVPGGGTGNISITVQLESTQTHMTDSVTGTGFDMSAAAIAFGMSPALFSALVWLVVTILICAAAYANVGGKTTLLIFDICIIGGTVLGLMPLLVAVLLFLGFGLFSAYVFFFRGASL